jgi:hypothetical protein
MNAYSTAADICSNTRRSGLSRAFLLRLTLISGARLLVQASSDRGAIGAGKTGLRDCSAPHC